MLILYMQKCIELLYLVVWLAILMVYLRRCLAWLWGHLSLSPRFLCLEPVVWHVFPDSAVLHPNCHMCPFHVIHYIAILSDPNHKAQGKTHHT